MIQNPHKPCCSNSLSIGRPLVSIILLSYNSASRILPTLDSIVAQDYPNFEIIFADDRSDDNTLSIIEDALQKITSRFVSIQVIRNRNNLGTVKNLENAVEASKGEYIKPIGAGDLLYTSDTISRYVEAAQKNKKTLIAGFIRPYYRTDDGIVTSNIVHPLPGMVSLFSSAKKALNTYLRDDYFFSGASLFYSRIFFEQNRLPGDIVYTEDLIQVLASARGYRIVPLGNCAIWYEKGSGISTNGSSNHLILADWISFYSSLGRIFEIPKIQNRFREKAKALKISDQAKNGARFHISTIPHYFFRLLDALNTKTMYRTGLLLKKSGDGFIDLLR